MQMLDPAQYVAEVSQDSSNDLQYENAPAAQNGQYRSPVADNYYNKPGFITPKGSFTPKSKGAFVPRRSARLAKVREKHEKTGTKWQGPLRQVADLRVAFEDYYDAKRKPKKSGRSGNATSSTSRKLMEVAKEEPVKRELRTPTRFDARRGSTAALVKAENVPRRAVKCEKACRQSMLKNLSPIKFMPTKRINGKQRVDLRAMAARRETIDLCTPEQRPMKLGTRTCRRLTRLAARQIKQEKRRVKKEPMGVNFSDTQVTFDGPSWLNLTTLSQNYTMCGAMTQYQAPEQAAVKESMSPQVIAIESQDSHGDYGFSQLCLATPAKSDIDMTQGQVCPTQCDVACQTLSLEQAYRKSLAPGVNKKMQWAGVPLPPLECLVDRGC